MLTHFQYKKLFSNENLPGWEFSFYFKKQRFTGIYHPAGTIEWTSSVSPEDSDKAILENQLHELMLFHVYE